MSDFDEKDLLTRELRERSEDVSGHTIGFNAVRQSAKKMRRRRAVVTGAVAVVVAGIAVPGGLALTSALNSSDGPVDSPTVATHPSEGTGPAPTPRADGTFRLTMQGLPRGAEPQVPYIDRREPAVVLPGDTLPMPTEYNEVTRYDEGWLALDLAADAPKMAMLDEDMTVLKEFPSGDRFAVSNDGGQVAYVEIQDDGSQYLVNAPTDGGDVQGWRFPTSPAVQPVGNVDRSTTVYQQQRDDGTSTAGLISPEGRTELTGFTSVTDADIVSGLVAGQTRSDLVNGSCYGVMDPASSTSTMLWETCDYSLDGFSPDGRYLIGSIPDFDNAAPTLVVLDALTKEVVVEFSPDKDDQTALLQRAWEDEDTVVAVALNGNTVTFLRFELDGTLEELTDPVKVDDPLVDFPYSIGTRRW